MEGYVLNSIRVYLVDDHDIVRRGLYDLLAAKRDITVVGDSGSAAVAVRRVPDLRPDVMVVDLRLQDGSGIQVCRQVRSVDPTIHALLVTSASDDEALFSALLAGASGYASKLIESSRILEKVRSVGAGRNLIESIPAERTRAALIAAGESGALGLTDGELELLRHVLEGLTNREIADLVQRPEEAVASEIALVIETVMGWQGLA